MLEPSFFAGLEEIEEALHEALPDELDTEIQEGCLSVKLPTVCVDDNSMERSDLEVDVRYHGVDDEVTVWLETTLLIEFRSPDSTQITAFLVRLLKSLYASVRHVVAAQARAAKELEGVLMKLGVRTDSLYAAHAYVLGVNTAHADDADVSFSVRKAKQWARRG